MTTPSRVQRAHSWALGAIVCAVLAGSGLVGAGRSLAGDQPNSDQSAGVQSRPEPWSAAGVAQTYSDPDAGSTLRTDVERCSACHEERRESIGTSAHADLLTKPAGCEACHGDGSGHAASDGDDPIRHPWDAPPIEVAGMCLRCHADVVVGPVRGHRAWLRPGGLDTPDVRACTHCHEIHVDRKSPAHAPDTGPFRDVAALDAAAEPIPAKRCIECHPGFHPAIARSGHAELASEGAACGTCHGDGSLHEASGGRARLIVNPARQRPSDSNDGCLRCHGGGATGSTVQRWTCSEHAREGTSCVTCHDANAAVGKTLRGSQFELCGGCHLDIKARLRLPHRHDVQKERVLCTDCHDPHANRARVRDVDVRRRACEGCHAEKAGPFLHDHGVKRSEGCVACHDPHGSVNRRMLLFARIKPFCLQCHAETTHDLAARRYDNCLSCHAEIHGSDVDRLLRR